MVKVNADAAAVNNTVRNAELRVEILQGKLQKVIKNHPSKVASLWQHALDLGITEDIIDVPEEPTHLSKEKQAQLKRKDSARDVRKQAKESSLVQAQAAGAAEPTPAKFKTMLNVSTPVLRGIAAHLEPGTWSGVNLTHFSRQLGQDGYRKLIEFATGCGGATVVHPKFLCLMRFKDHLKEKARARGNRGMQLTLPPDFNAKGLFALGAVRDGWVSVEQRFTGETKQIKVSDMCKVTDPKTVTRLTQLELINNHSEQDAAVGVIGEVDAFHLRQLDFNHIYIDVTSKTPSPKKRMLCKENPSEGSRDEKKFKAKAEQEEPVATGEHMAKAVSPSHSSAPQTPMQPSREEKLESPPPA
eukprot:2257298-Amphidinium_carterae.2